MNTLYDLLQAGRIYLKERDIADADVDAWYLLAHVFGINRTQFYMCQSDTVTENKCHDYMALIKLRANHTPLQHITGLQEFMGFEFEVNEHVLIPRQDTECLVEEVLKVCNQKTVLDMCTGSGCIIISIAKLGNILHGVGVDISEEALKIATKNARRHKVEIDLIQSDLFDKVCGQYDIIVSNPPYIRSEIIPTLMPEVKNHEPILALDGSSDGLIFYSKIISSLDKYLKQNGFIFFEIGHDQGMEVKNLLQEAGFYNVNIKKDLSGHDRVVYGNKC